MWDFLSPFDQIFGETLSPTLQPLPAMHSRHIVSPGDAGTAQTIRLMQKMVQQQKLVNNWKRDDNVRQLVGQILNGIPADAPTTTQAHIPTNRPCASKDYACYAKTLYEFCRDDILYTFDPHMVEYIESPMRVIKNRIGDCDSKDMLLCAMLEQIGLQTQFVTVKADAERPNEFSHVYCRVKIPNVGWVAADPTMPKYFGWEPPEQYPKRYWPATTDAAYLPLDTSPCVNMSGLRGMNALGFELDSQNVKLLGLALGLGVLWFGWKMFKAAGKGWGRVKSHAKQSLGGAGRIASEEISRKADREVRAAIRRRIGEGDE